MTFLDGKNANDHYTRTLMAEHLELSLNGQTAEVRGVQKKIQIFLKYFKKRYKHRYTTCGKVGN